MQIFFFFLVTIHNGQETKLYYGKVKNKKSEDLDFGSLTTTPNSNLKPKSEALKSKDFTLGLDVIEFLVQFHNNMNKLM